MQAGSLRLSKRDASGGASLKDFDDVVIPNFSSLWTGHPEASVDLGFLPLLPALRSAGRDPTSLYWEPIPDAAIPDADFLATINPVSDVLVVGYPAGLADFTHNLPIFRRGITASSASLHFQNLPCFLVDCEIWQGSSGSPVFSYYNGVIPLPGQGYTIGTDVRLLGVIADAISQRASGDVQIEPAPLSKTPIEVMVPNGLGVAMTSQSILDFENVLISSGFKPPADYVPRKAVD